MCHFLAPARQPEMMHESFMHWHLCMFVVRCSCMKLYTENYSLGESFNRSCNVTRSVSKMTEIERRGGKRWDKPKKAEKSRDCGGGKF